MTIKEQLQFRNTARHHLYEALNLTEATLERVRAEGADNDFDAQLAGFEKLLDDVIAQVDYALV